MLSLFGFNYKMHMTSESRTMTINKCGKWGNKMQSFFCIVCRKNMRHATHPRQYSNAGRHLFTTLWKRVHTSLWCSSLHKLAEERRTVDNFTWGNLSYMYAAALTCFGIRVFLVLSRGSLRISNPFTRFISYLIEIRCN